MPQAQEPQALQEIQRLWELFGMSAVLATAQELRLLELALERPIHPEECAAQLALTPEALEQLLEALSAFGLFVRQGSSYEAAPVLRMLASTPGRTGFKATIDIWSHLPRFVRTGEPAWQMDGSAAQSESSYREVAADLGRFLEGAARTIAKQIEPLPKRVLDVGCGSGVFGLAIAERAAQAHVVGLDWPAVLESFVARARALGLEERVSCLGGDMHQIELPREAFDLAVIAHVLRLENKERARSLVHKVAQSLRPEGSLLIVDALAHGTEARDRARVLYGLHLALRTQNGRVKTPGDVRAWLEEAGFTRIDLLELPDLPGAVGALLARRSA